MSRTTLAIIGAICGIFTMMFALSFMATMNTADGIALVWSIAACLVISRIESDMTQEEEES